MFNLKNINFKNYKVELILAFINIILFVISWLPVFYSWHLALQFIIQFFIFITAGFIFVKNIIKFNLKGILSSIILFLALMFVFITSGNLWEFGLMKTLVEKNYCNSKTKEEVAKNGEIRVLGDIKGKVENATAVYYSVEVKKGDLYFEFPFIFLRSYLYKCDVENQKLQYVYTD